MPRNSWEPCVTKIRNFRTFSEDFKINLFGNFIGLIGNNGSGKTNFCNSLKYLVCAWDLSKHGYNCQNSLNSHLDMEISPEIFLSVLFSNKSYFVEISIHIQGRNSIFFFIGKKRVGNPSYRKTLKIFGFHKFLDFFFVDFSSLSQSTFNRSEILRFIDYSSKSHHFSVAHLKLLILKIKLEENCGYFYKKIRIYKKKMKKIGEIKMVNIEKNINEIIKGFSLPLKYISLKVFYLVKAWKKNKNKGQISRKLKDAFFANLCISYKIINEPIHSKKKKNARNFSTKIKEDIEFCHKFWLKNVDPLNILLNREMLNLFQNSKNYLWKFYKRKSGWDNLKKFYKIPFVQISCPHRISSVLSSNRSIKKKLLAFNVSFLFEFSFNEYKCTKEVLFFGKKTRFTNFLRIKRHEKIKGFSIINFKKRSKIVRHCFFRQMLLKKTALIYISLFSGFAIFSVSLEKSSNSKKKTHFFFQRFTLAGFNRKEFNIRGIFSELYKPLDSSLKKLALDRVDPVFDVILIHSHLDIKKLTSEIQSRKENFNFNFKCIKDSFLNQTIIVKKNLKKIEKIDFDVYDAKIIFTMFSQYGEKYYRIFENLTQGLENETNLEKKSKFSVEISKDRHLFTFFPNTVPKKFSRFLKTKKERIIFCLKKRNTPKFYNNDSDWLISPFKNFPWFFNFHDNYRGGGIFLEYKANFVKPLFENDLLVEYIINKILIMHFKRTFLYALHTRFIFFWKQVMFFDRILIFGNFFSLKKNSIKDSVSSVVNIEANHRLIRKRENKTFFLAHWIVKTASIVFIKVFYYYIKIVVKRSGYPIASKKNLLVFENFHTKKIRILERKSAYLKHQNLRLINLNKKKEEILLKTFFLLTKPEIIKYTNQTNQKPKLAKSLAPWPSIISLFYIVLDLILYETEKKQIFRIVGKKNKMSNHSTGKFKGVEYEKTLHEKINFLQKLLKYNKKKFLRASLRLEKVVKSRNKSFLTSFSYISERIQHNYRELTKSNKYPLGGTSIISLSDKIFPYFGTLDIVFIPPKRTDFKNINLSGGEYAIGYVSILICLQESFPTPIIIFDEVDANLDYWNCKKLFKQLFILSVFNKQCIINITHKLKLITYFSRVLFFFITSLGTQYLIL